MSDYYETLLLRKEELEDIAYREQLEKEEHLKNNPYYWLVETEQWEEWTYTKEELIKEVNHAHKNQLKVRIKRFNDFND
tara:strand:- start:2689 stop:2925 length:237 start_codon:yes stop_codon:yes gene_type:complete